jgi:ketosteroid isomerase-like protein
MKNADRRAPFASCLVLIAGVIFGHFILSPTGASAAGGPGMEEEIRAVISAQAAAWNRGDIDEFMKGYNDSPSTQFVSGDKLTRGWQTVRDRYKKKYGTAEKMGSLTFSEITVTPLSADAAVVIGRWRLARKTDQPHGRFTLIFRRTPNGWRIVHDHTSSAEK